MRALVTGAGGMLGRDLLAELEAGGHALTAVDKAEGDVTRLEDCLRMVAAARPDVVFHLAAWTDVDGAEGAERAAFEVNALGARNVAIAARECCAGVLYVSTDYVFDGRKQGPYLEDDPKRPLSAYGRTKDAGEELIRIHNPLHWIVRSSWLYGDGGRNFVEAILRLARERDHLQVVNDQRGAPTWTRHLAPALVAIAAGAPAGVLHATSAGATTWYDFACRILESAGLDLPVAPLRSEDLDRPARRPANSLLADRALRRAGVAPLPPWEQGLAGYLAARSEAKAI